jgi:hypothetical protein
MTKKARRVLFYGLIALFLVGGAAVVFYSQGWRLDLASDQATKIGAIYVRSYPKDADIFLNGKSVQNKSGFLSPGTLISDLFPKTYSLRLTETGYEPWQENVTVLPSFVAPLKNAVLIPQKSTAAASGTAQRFFAAPGIVVRESVAGTISSNGKLVGQGTLAASTMDGSAIMFKDASGNNRLYDTRNSTTINLTALLQKDGIAPSAIQNTIFDPHDGSQIIIVGPKKIWSLDLSQQSLTLIEKTPTTDTLSPSIAISDSLIAWTRFESASGTSEIALYDRNARTLRGSSTTVADATKKIALIRGGQFGILQKDGSLYLYDSGADTMQKLADDATDFSTSADGTMVAVLERSSTEFFDLNDPTNYYRFNLPAIAQVQQLIWYKDDDHLFVVYPNYISFLDLQDASLANFTTVTQGTSPAYDPNSNSLYFISPASQLMQLVFPT